jgi:glycosyltransferase involved in cell wall biosynthesis
VTIPDAPAVKGHVGVFSYAVGVVVDGRVRTNDRFGSLVDGLAEQFDRVTYVFSEVRGDDPHFVRDGVALYDYSISAENVDWVTTVTAKAATALKRLAILGRNLFRYRTAVRRCDYAYIFMPGLSGVAVTLLCRLYRKPYFLYFGADWYETARFRANWQGSGRLLYRLYCASLATLERITVRHARFVLVTGKSFLARIKRYNQEVQETVPMLGIDRGDVFEKREHLDARRVRLLFVGPVTERKGVSYLVEAVALLPKYGIPIEGVELRLVGTLDDSYWEKILATQATAAVAERLHYEGYVSDKGRMLDYYRTADIFVLPSLGEGFPRVLYEAFSQDLPVIASRITSISATLGDCECVAYAEPGSAESIAEAIASVVHDAGRRQALVRSGKRFVMSRLGGDPVRQVVSLVAAHVPEAAR